MSVLELSLKVDKQFNPFPHPSQLKMEKAIRLKMAVIIVVDRGGALAVYSLLEPCVRLTAPRARQIATAAMERAFVDVVIRDQHLLRRQPRLARISGDMECSSNFASYWMFVRFSTHTLLQTRAFSTFFKTRYGVFVYMKDAAFLN